MSWETVLAGIKFWNNAFDDGVILGNSEIPFTAEEQDTITDYLYKLYTGSDLAQQVLEQATLGLGTLLLYQTADNDPGRAQRGQNKAGFNLSAIQDTYYFNSLGVLAQLPRGSWASGCGEFSIGWQGITH